MLFYLVITFCIILSLLIHNVLLIKFKKYYSLLLLEHISVLTQLHSLGQLIWDVDEKMSYAMGISS